MAAVEAVEAVQEVAEEVLLIEVAEVVLLARALTSQREVLAKMTLVTTNTELKGNAMKRKTKKI